MVTVIPRSDAESRTKSIKNIAVITGFRVGARNDNYQLTA